MLKKRQSYNFLRNIEARGIHGESRCTIFRNDQINKYEGPTALCSGAIQVKTSKSTKEQSWWLLLRSQDASAGFYFQKQERLLGSS